MPECYIRGSTIKYLRIPDEIIDMVKEEVVAKGRGRGGLQQQKQQKGRGMGGAGRGRPSVPFLLHWQAAGASPLGGDRRTRHLAWPGVDILHWCHHLAEGLALSPSSMALGGRDSRGSSVEELTLLLAACMPHVPAPGAQLGAGGQCWPRPSPQHGPSSPQWLSARQTSPVPTQTWGLSPACFSEGALGTSRASAPCREDPHGAQSGTLPAVTPLDKNEVTPFG